MKKLAWQAAEAQFNCTAWQTNTHDINIVLLFYMGSEKRQPLEFLHKCVTYSFSIDLAIVSLHWSDTWHKRFPLISPLLYDWYLYKDTQTSVLSCCLKHHIHTMITFLLAFSFCIVCRTMLFYPDWVRAVQRVLTVLWTYAKVVHQFYPDELDCTGHLKDMLQRHK